MSMEPIPGLYRTRLCRGGPYVPVKIFFLDGERDPETGELLSDQKMIVRCGDQEKDYAWALDRWIWMEPIQRAEYDYLLSTGRWAAKNAPEHPAANPTRRIDLEQLPPIF